MQGKWRAIAELIGISAVVLSLLLVVMELRQTQSAISAAAHSERTNRNLEVLKVIMEHGADEITAKQQAGEKLTFSEQQILINVMQMKLRHFEDLHYQHMIGTLSEETWAANQRGLRWTIDDELFLQSWPQIKQFYRSGFVAFVDALL